MNKKKSHPFFTGTWNSDWLNFPASSEPGITLLRKSYLFPQNGHFLLTLGLGWSVKSKGGPVELIPYHSTELQAALPPCELISQSRGSDCSVTKPSISAFCHTQRYVVAARLLPLDMYLKRLLPLLFVICVVQRRAVQRDRYHMRHKIESVRDRNRKIYMCRTKQHALHM